MPLLVRHRRAAELVSDHDKQLARGGFLVRCTPPASLAQFAQEALVLDVAIGELTSRLTIDAQIVQVFAGVGVAVTFDPKNLAPFADVVQAARALGDEPGADTEHTWVAIVPAIDPPSDDDDSDDEAEARRALRAVPELAVDRVRKASGPEKMQLALRGGRDERMLLMRENNPQLHLFVLKNPSLGIDEVLAIAKLRTVTPDVLKQISERREWQRADIALALIRNPKTPVGIAVKLLDHIAMSDVRALAKDTRTRAQIQTAARKKVIPT
ncbi:MAG: hypothetical protein ACHREM_23785 [Polyangiales bacterium]